LQGFDAAAGAAQAGEFATARAICAGVGSCLARLSTPINVIPVSTTAKLNETARWTKLVFMVMVLGGRCSVSMPEL
jgi:hypothetical protein